MIRTVDPKHPWKITRTFASYDEYLTLANNNALPENPGSSRKQSDNEWSGTKTFDDAMKLAREGWPEGLALIEKLTAGVERYSGSLVKKPEVQWDVAGDFADAGLYATGVPECMGSFTEAEAVEGSGKVLRIIINGFYSSGFDAATIMRRGAATLALIDALENAGRSCELVMALSGSGSMNKSSNDIHTELVPLKQAGEAAEMDRLAFICAHPASFRRIGFSVGENEDKETREHFGCYQGGFYYFPATYTDDTADIVIPDASFFVAQDERSLMQWIAAELKKQGCELEGDDLLAAK